MRGVGPVRRFARRAWEEIALSELDTLFTLAEIAVGMAGFSAIVVLFKRRDSGKWLPSDADRFNGMLIHAMTAAFFCVLPAFADVFVSPAAIWTACSAVLGVQICVHIGIVVRLPSTSAITRAVVLTGGLIAVALQALNVAGRGIEHGFGPYLIGVLWHLFHAGALFLLLIGVRPGDVEGS